MKTHYLKTVQPYFDDVKSRKKTFEHRNNDRDFQVNDLVVLQEYDPIKKTYLSRDIHCVITYVLKDFEGIDPDFCIFSFIIKSESETTIAE